MGKQSRRRPARTAGAPTAPRTLPANTHPFYESQFRPIELSNELRADDCVQAMLRLVCEGHLDNWQLGRKGTHISSHFVTTGGTRDYLTSPDPNDSDYLMLVKAHMQRAIELIKSGN